jgi:hypothetical protein
MKKKMMNKQRQLADLLTVEAELERVWSEAEEEFKEKKKLAHLCKTLHNYTEKQDTFEILYQLEF